MDILSNKLVVTRKKHYCFACLRKFEKGSRLWSTVFVDGEICNSYSCKTCNELITKHHSVFSDDHYFDEGCVTEVLRYSEYKSNTPEELLKFLNLKNEN